MENGELSDEQLQSMPADFHELDLIERMERGPVRWDMLVTVGELGHPETDPTMLWPKGRKEIKAGTLTITAAMPQRGA
jgi:catalase